MNKYRERYEYDLNIFGKETYKDGWNTTLSMKDVFEIQIPLNSCFVSYIQYQFNGSKSNATKKHTVLLKPEFYYEYYWIKSELKEIPEDEADPEKISVLSPEDRQALQMDFKSMLYIDSLDPGDIFRVGL